MCNKQNNKHIITHRHHDLTWFTQDGLRPQWSTSYYIIQNHPLQNMHIVLIHYALVILLSLYLSLCHSSLLHSHILTYFIHTFLLSFYLLPYSLSQNPYIFIQLQ
jgi:hypothetical protein